MLFVIGCSSRTLTTTRGPWHEINLNKDNKGKFVMLSLSFLYLTANHFIVHPYLLADNRHYIFYIFKMISKMRWAMCPVYAVGLVSIFFQMPKVKPLFNLKFFFIIKFFSLEHFNAFGFYLLHRCHPGTSKTFRISIFYGPLHDSSNF